MTQEWLPTKLRLLRAERGLTLVEAADNIGIGRDTLSDLERGRRHPVMPTLAKIARGYDVPVAELLELEEPAPPGKAQAPSPPESEERREDLRNVRKALAGVHELLETLFKEYEAARDGRKLTNLTALAILSSLGASRFVQEEVGPMNDRESERIYLVGTRYEELVDDLLEALDSMPEQVEEASVVVDMREWLLREKAS